MLKWLAGSACAQRAPFALKVDDDMWVDVPALVTLLRNCARRPAGGCDGPVAAGRLYAGVTAYRNAESKYYLPPRLLADDALPDFLSGTAYVVSGPAAAPLYRAALDTPFVNLEDVFVTGLAARRAGVRLLHVPAFREARPLWVHPCTCRSYVTVHGLTAEQLDRLEAATGEQCGPLWTVVNWLMPWVV